MHEGGAQRALSNIQSELSDRYEIDTLVNSEFDRVYSNSGRVFSLGIDTPPKTGSLLFQFSAFIKRFIRLKELKKKGSYEACISFMDSANVSNVISGKGRCKVIVSVRVSYNSNNDLPQYRFVVKPLARLLYNKADLVVAVSEELKMELNSGFGICSDRLVAIPNGYNVNKIRNEAVKSFQEAELRDYVACKMVLTAGRLNAQKHQWHLIRAFSEVLKSVPSAILVIAGTGELEEYLKKTCIRLGIEDKVIFLGFSNNVFGYMSRTDVFVLPSGWEGFPNALGEAICIGAPCVATDFKTGAREILAPELLLKNKIIERAECCEYGILTPVCSGRMYNDNEPLEDAEMILASALTKMLEQKELNETYRKKSIERSRDLDIDPVIKKWIDAIEKQ